MPDGWTENKIDACLGLSQALTALGEHEQAKRALTLSFALEVPRSAGVLVRLQPSNMRITAQDRRCSGTKQLFEPQAQDRTALLM